MQYGLMQGDVELVVSEDKQELIEIRDMYTKRNPASGLKIVNHYPIRRGHLKRSEGTPVTTTKRRVKTAFDEETYHKLLWLYEEHKKRAKERIYICDTLKELIDNEYTIRKSFR